MKTKIFFLGILLIAFFLRFINLDNVPPSLNWDEVSIGYNAYSILKTGTDEWGKFMPLNFRAFGDYKLPLYIYADIPFIALFGLNAVGVRLLSVLSGLGVVILSYLILKNLTKNNTIALIGMFTAATLPWLIILSRIGLEANFALFLVTLFVYLFLRGVEEKRFLVWSGIPLGLSLFTYNSSRVTTPFLIFAAVILFWNKLKSHKRESILAAVVLIFFVSVVIPLALFSDSSARFQWTTILDEGAILSINQERGLSSLPAAFKPLVYNKVTYFIVTSAQNYLSYYNPDFLFINGGSNFQFSVPGTGLLFWALIPFFLIGIFYVLSKRKDCQLFILAWLFIAPIPGSITRDAPHALRSLFIIPPIIIISSLGIVFLGNKLKQTLFKIVILIFLLLMVFQTYLFWVNYNGSYRQEFSWSWQYGYKQAMEYIQVNYSNYSKIVITKSYGEPHEFLLFYLKYDSYKYQHDLSLVRYERSQWFWVDRFDKFEFINDWEIKDRMKNAHNTLLVTSPGNYPPGSAIVQTIDFLDGKRAFDIVDIE
ncbi:MAG: phospholipid carrier-dependent glycosyltransferase [Microgenomates group bacterium]|jgi:4-amino-4-deoxy-L-arabinose transferase-like glycosyltransferase